MYIYIHIYMCTPPHSLHQRCLPVHLLSANLCVYPIAYIHTRTHSHDEINILKMSASVCAYKHTDQKKELYQKRERPKETERKCEGGGRWK